MRAADHWSASGDVSFEGSTYSRDAFVKIHPEVEGVNGGDALWNGNDSGTEFSEEKDANQEGRPGAKSSLWERTKRYWANVGTAAKMTAGWILGVGENKSVFMNDRVADAMRKFTRNNSSEK